MFNPLRDPRNPHRHRSSASGYKHATFLLPSFPGFLGRRKQGHGPEAEPSRVAPPSHRSSVASAVSSRTDSSAGSTGSTDSSRTTAPSLCTSPDVLSLLTDVDAALTAEPETTATTLPPPSTSTRSTVPPPSRRRRLARAHPDTLRCRRCGADLAFAAQIVSKGFTGRHGRAYLVSAPATAAAHLLAPGVPETEFPGDESDSNTESPPFDRARFRDDARDAPLPNVRVGPRETRQLLTGAHVVADVECAQCAVRLGWKYVDARETAQRYKAGKYILDVVRVTTHRGWEDVEGAGDGDDGDDEDHGGLDAVRRLQTAVAGDGGVDDDDDDDDDDDAAAVEFDSGDEDECEEIFSGTWDAATVAARRRRRRAEA